MRALDIAATGMAAQATRVAIISNNISNMSTTGYNARRAEFADLHYQQVRQPGSVTSLTGTQMPTGIQLGLGVRMSAVNMRVEQGSLIATGGDLDVAIEGKGWFPILLPDGQTAYTRDGAFKRDPEGLIVNSEGYQVGDGITIPNNARRVQVTAQGDVYVSFQGVAEPAQVGTIDLTTFINAKGLEAIGGNLFLQSTASGEPTIGTPGEEGVGTLRQGYLEASSVDVVEQITDLIEAQRGYEMNSKVISAADQMLSATVQLR
jgi:flagellar basal-body rod protein FlgG